MSDQGNTARDESSVAAYDPARNPSFLHRLASVLQHDRTLRPDAIGCSCVDHDERKDVYAMAEQMVREQDGPVRCWRDVEGDPCMRPLGHSDDHSNAVEDADAAYHVACRDTMTATRPHGGTFRCVLPPGHPGQHTAYLTFFPTLDITDARARYQAVVTWEH